MMGKVVKLKEKTATVELAEKLLALCKSGDVVGFSYAAVVNSVQAPTCSASAFITDANPIHHKLLLAAIEEMRHEFKHALRGG